MPGSWVADVSAVAKLYFEEDLSSTARARLGSVDFLIAPDLFNLEMANVAAKRARRGTASRQSADRAVTEAPALIDEFVVASDLVGRAYELAVDCGFSAYDAAYLALAEDRGLKVLTADAKLVRRANETGLSHLVEALAGDPLAGD